MPTIPRARAASMLTGLSSMKSGLFGARAELFKS